MTLPAPYYQDDYATIYHGDCREILPHLGPVDLAITDPPYGISAVLGMGGGDKGLGGMWKGIGIDGDNDTEARDVALSFCRSFAAFGSPKRCAPDRTRAILVWDKGEHTGAGDLSFPWKPSFEFIFIGGDGWQSQHRCGGVIRANAIAGCVGNQNNGFRFHPFEKPESIINHLIQRHAAPVVLDPFMGSGTTLVAAKNLGRKAIGIEIEKKYCEIAVKRLRQEVLPL